jgi:hypothetical protein
MKMKKSIIVVCLIFLLSIIMDLCQYFGHKKLNIFSLHDINT